MNFKTLAFSFVCCLTLLVFAFGHAQEAAYTADSVINKLLIESNDCRIKSINYSCATSKAKQALDKSISKQNSLGQIYAYKLLGYALRDQINYDAAIVELKKAVELASTQLTQENNPKIIDLKINCLTAISAIYLKKPDIDAAKKYAFQALEISETYNINKGQSWIALSKLFSIQNNISQAKKYAYKALDQFKLENNAVDYARVLANLAYYAYEEHFLDSAIYYYERSYAAYTSVNNTYGERVCLFNLANLKLEQGDYHMADSIAQQAEIKFDNQDIIALYHLTELRVSLNLKSENYGLALTLVEKAVGYAEKEKSAELLLSAYKLKREIAYKKEDLKTYYFLSNKIESLEDSVYKVNVTKETQKIASEYELKLKTKEVENNKVKSRIAELKFNNDLLLNKQLLTANKLISDSLDKAVIEREFLENKAELQLKNLENELTTNALLKKQNVLYEKQTKYEYAIMLLLLIALVGASIIIYAFKNNLAKQKKINRLLEDQKKLLSLNINEINHRIKNNLQLINSLLNFQSRKAVDKGQLELLNNTRNRIMSIALVHNQLAYTDDTATIIASDYLTSITKAIIEQFAPLENRIKIDFTLQPNRTIDASKAILVGMILNELLINYIKHALTEKSNFISITTHEIDDKTFDVIIEDNNFEFNPLIEHTNSKGIGLKLIRLFAEQSKIQLSYQHTDFNQLTITI